MAKGGADIFFDRELSWLAFNGRVLQEAEDRSVPVFLRLAFLAIFSSNLDEFFRVRVAALRSLLRLKKKTVDRLDLDPVTLLRRIHDTVAAQQERFGTILRDEILPDLGALGIHLVDEARVSEAQGALVRAFFDAYVRPHVTPRVIDEASVPFLENKRLYLVAELWPPSAGKGPGLGAAPPQYGLVEIPSPPVPRFTWLPGDDEHRYVMFVDDVVRHSLSALFPDYRVGASCAVKLSRDADLYLDDEYEGDLVDKIRKSLGKRATGLPCRFLYDLRAPYAMVAFMRKRFGLAEEDLVPGGRYHNLNDFWSFPRFGFRADAYTPMPPLPHPALDRAPSVRAVIAEKDCLLHVPYQSFGYVTRWLEEAADDPAVDAIWITLYRAAKDSTVVAALLRAAERGKRVTVFVEVKARFDEAANLQWAEQLEAAGVKTLYSMPGVKVHAKVALVSRREEEGPKLYAYLGTGNFNERTAHVYADHGLLTADPRLTREVRELFAYLEGEVEEPLFEHLLVAPFTMRKGFYRLIEAEVEAARAGQTARMTLKMNSLEDRKIIRRLYQASRAGVEVRLIVRGICCLKAGVPGMSDRITVRSIVDRFLEHARVYVFHHGGEERVYLASADWMKRNLSNRVEVAFPIYDDDLRREVRELLALQLADNTKARLVDALQENAYAPADGQPRVRAQLDTYRYLQDKHRPLRHTAAPDAAPDAVPAGMGDGAA